MLKKLFISESVFFILSLICECSDFLFLFSHSKNCFRVSRFTDIKIFLDGEEFYAHKIVIASRSPVFNDYLLGSPKTDAGGWNVLDNEDFVRIGKIDRELFGIILEYMYSGKIANSVFKVRSMKKKKVKDQN